MLLARSTRRMFTKTKVLCYNYYYLQKERTLSHRNNGETRVTVRAASSVEIQCSRQAGRRGELARRPAGRRCQLGSIIWSLPATPSSADPPTTQLFAVDSPATAAQSAFGTSICWFVHRPFLSFAPFQYFCSTEADRYKFFTSL